VLRTSLGCPQSGVGESGADGAGRRTEEREIDVVGVDGDRRVLVLGT
jgi:hypothetical protein